MLWTVLYSYSLWGKSIHMSNVWDWHHLPVLSISLIGEGNGYLSVSSIIGFWFCMWLHLCFYQSKWDTKAVCKICRGSTGRASWFWARTLITGTFCSLKGLNNGERNENVVDRMLEILSSSSDLINTCYQLKTSFFLMTSTAQHCAYS